MNTEVYQNEKELKLGLINKIKNTAIENRETLIQSANDILAERLSPIWNSRGKDDIPCPHLTVEEWTRWNLNIPPFSELLADSKFHKHPVFKSFKFYTECSQSMYTGPLDLDPCGIYIPVFSNFRHYYIPAADSENDEDNLLRTVNRLPIEAFLLLKYMIYPDIWQEYEHEAITSSQTQAEFHLLVIAYVISEINEFYKVCTLVSKLLEEDEIATTPKLAHPLTPLVFEWVDGYIRNWIPETEPERRKNQILPRDLPNSPQTTIRERLPVGLLFNQGETEDIKQMMLPGFYGEESPIVPALPLDIYEVSDGIPMQAGRGAPLAQRLWINAILAYPMAERQSDGARKLKTSLRDLKDWVYPNNWNRTRYLPRIIEALDELHNIRTRWQRRRWSLVQVHALPDLDARLDDPLPLIVRLPDGMSGYGALIDVEVLRLVGVKSAAQFRAWIRLAYIWDVAKQKNGGNRIYATRPKVLRNSRSQVIDKDDNPIPSGSWNDPKAIWTGGVEENPAAERVSVLSERHLVELFFDDTPTTSGAYRKRLERAKLEAFAMQTEGYIVIKTNVVCPKTGVKGWRILEPRSEKVDNFSK